MADYPTSREELSEKCEAMTMPMAIQRGRELREEGYKLVTHWISPDSVEIPGGEHFDETRLKVRYGMVENKRELEKGFEYLILCETMLGKTSVKERGYELT